MKAAVIAWGNTMRQQALKAAFALGPLRSREGEVCSRQDRELCSRQSRELWVFGAEMGHEEYGDLPYDQVLVLEGFGNLYMGGGQYAEEFTRLIKDRGVEIAVFPDCPKGEELAVCVSLGLGTAASVKITSMKEEGGKILMERRVYGGNLEGCFQPPGSAFAMTFDGNSAEESGERGRPLISRKQVLAKYREELICCEENELPPCDGPEHARRLVVAGRGAVGSGAVEELSHVLGAGFGATRPAVMEAALPYSAMIGMSGVIAKPELCMVFGASGSEPFMIGVKGSHVLAAVNSNPDAAVFRYCDFRVVDDAGEFAEAFLDVVREKEGET